MTIFQAILVGMIYYLNACAFGGSTFELFFRYPINNVLWVGLIFGNVPAAMKIGATIQPMYLGMLYLGSVMPTDMASGGIIASTFALAYGMDVDAAITLSIPVATIFAQLQTIWKTVCSVCYRYADKAVEQRKYEGLFIAHVVMSYLIKIVIFWVPMTLLVYFGGETITNVANNLPKQVLAGFAVCSKMMPAIGFAMIIKMIGKPNLMPYFLAGFFFYGYVNVLTGKNISSIGIGLLGFFLAWLYYNNHKKEGEGKLLDSFKITGESNAYKGAVTKKDVSEFGGVGCLVHT